MIRSFSLNLLGDDQGDLEALHEHIYKTFVEALDAVDNGVNQVPLDTPLAYARPFSIIDHVSILNNTLPETKQSVAKQEFNCFEFLEDNFVEALKVADEALSLVIRNQLAHWLPSRHAVKNALQDQQSNLALFLKDAPHLDAFFKHLLILPKQGIHWKEHVAECEPEPGQLLFVIYLEEANGTWRVQAVPLGPASFANRLSLHETWRGLRDFDLDAAIKETLKQNTRFSHLTCEEGAVFVHKSGFIGGHKSCQGAVMMAALTIALHQSAPK